MVEPWIIITILGAFFQNLRSALQKQSAVNLSILGASYVRFLFAFPFAIIYLLGIQILTDHPLPTANEKFFMYCFLASTRTCTLTCWAWLVVREGNMFFEGCLRGCLGAHFSSLVQPGRMFVCSVSFCVEIAVS